ncbi:E3 ubiquitin-protein ligase RAD18 isoform X2 [Rhea pennata]|uniref:E3 ubiquitin-protein ligase RAD18 isoform X2 n=1 Tax=Rhea pennata TaxID=8795 RepID=UPI002E264D72
MAAAALALPLAEPPWPPSLAPLKAVDDLLRCGICFDYFNIAMIIPQCSHNYCSLCIRKFLSYKTQCPTCCVAVSESDLKNNRTLDELVKSFNSARQQLFQLVMDTPVISSPLACSRQSTGKSHVRSPVAWPVKTGQKEEVPVIDGFLKKENVRTPAKTDGLAETDGKVCKTENHYNLCSSSPEACGKDNEVGSGKSPVCAKNHEEPSTSMAKLVKKVDCPVCGVTIPEQYINKHLDSCLAREEKKDSLRSSGHKRKTISKVVYNLLSDRDLKKKLKEQGLSTHGTRQQLVKRHQEFVHMYNAQCDSLNPKSVAEIVKELEKNEKIRVQLEFNKPGENSLTFTKDQTEKEIDEVHADYRKKHRSEFQFLVDQVNNRWKKSGKRKTESAQNTGEATAEKLPTDTGDDAQKQHMNSAVGTDQIPKTEIADCKISESNSPEEGQRSVSPTFSQSSGSTSSSSSDILRDLQGTEMYSESSDNVSDLRVNKKKLCRSRMPENDQLLPKSKRKKS